MTSYPLQTEDSPKKIREGLSYGVTLVCKSDARTMMLLFPKLVHVMHIVCEFDVSMTRGLSVLGCNKTGSLLPPIK